MDLSPGILVVPFKGPDFRDIRGVLVIMPFI